MELHYLYLALMGGSLLVPLLRSFESRIAFYKSFKELFTAILLVGVVFIVWDIIFTRTGIWGFNSRYLSGIYIANLPLGEWLFFVVIPFCCVFIYRVMIYFVKEDKLARHTKSFSNFLLGFSASLAIIFYDRWYTVITFGFLTIAIYLHGRVWHSPWLGRFYLAYLVILIPFFVVNGVLTGMGIEEQVVWYNDAETIGTRIGTVPVEDIFYGMLLVLGVTSIYEYLHKRKTGRYFAEEA